MRDRFKFIAQHSMSNRTKAFLNMMRLGWNKAVAYGVKIVITAVLIILLITVGNCSISFTSLESNCDLENANSNNLKTRAYPERLTIETPHFEIDYYEGKEIYARTLASVAESVYDDACVFANYTPETKINIDIYQSWETLGFRAYSTGDYFGIHTPFQTEWSLGFINYPRIKATIAHELNHVLLCKKLNLDYLVALYPYPSPLPWWYVDGLANYFPFSYYYPQGNSYAQTLVKSYINKNDLRMLDEMIWWEDSGYGYCEGYSIFKFIADNYGNQTLRIFQDNVEKNLDAKMGINETFNMTQEQFETEWLEWLNHEFTKDVVWGKVYGYPLTDSEDIKVPSSWHGNKILYVSDKNENLDIFMMDDNGTNVQQLTDHLMIDTDPKWSPDGIEILFTSNRGMNYGVYIMGSNGSNVTPLIDDQYINIAGSWSPDGSKILFISDRSGNYDIFSANKDGSEITQLTTDLSSDGSPVFSPDGERILFVSNRSGSYQLYIMNSDGTNIMQLTFLSDIEGDVYAPWWSPDGSRIMFAINDWTGGQICTMNVNDTTPKILIEPGPLLSSTGEWTYVGYPVWSEDGDEIVFSCDGEIYVLNFSEEKIGITTFQMTLIVIVTAVSMVMVGVWIYRNKRKRKSL